jgi:hypothetical protein
MTYYSQSRTSFPFVEAMTSPFSPTTSNLSRSLFGSIQSTANWSKKQARLNSKWTRLTFYLVLVRSLLVITLQFIVALLFIQNVNQYTATDDKTLDMLKRCKNMIVYHYMFIMVHLYLIVAWWDAACHCRVI